MHSPSRILPFLITLLHLSTFTVAYKALSNHTLSHLPFPHDLLSLTSPSSILTPILIPRVPGTPGSLVVLRHFLNFFATQLPEWKVTLQNSTSSTPHSGDPTPFVNLIATRDPPHVPSSEVSRLTLVAHYDSKLHPTGFIGATDSAAPCAIILAAALAVDAALTAKWSSPDHASSAGSSLNPPPGIQILLLDGEEAFATWSHTDSLYGARSLAAHWESSSPNPPLSTYATPLHQISLFVLLDLLGAPAPTIPSYYVTTHWAYVQLADMEARLRVLHLLQSPPAKFLYDTSIPIKGQMQIFGIEDDHLPFLQRGVECLHLIPVPFPDCWHEQKGIKDDITALDQATVEDWGVIIAGWVGGWLDLEGWFHIPGGKDHGGDRPPRDTVDRLWGEGWPLRTEL